MTRKISRRDLLKGLLPASAALSVVPTVLQARTAVAFYHGIASGDPTQTAVILWTRVTTSRQQLEVAWQLATDSEFENILASGQQATSAAVDYTVKVDVTGLHPATDYYYRFSAMGAQSAVGKTRTLPDGAVESFYFGVCSCANYPAGYFNAYGAMADRQDIDVVIHLGDYIYEYDAQGYASASAAALGRTSEPMNEITRLEDYRRRHAQYKTDKNLQRLHAQKAFILSWDDHEVANNNWHAGAENHSEAEGSWPDRKAAALQAYYEWMPIREPAGGDHSKQWRSFEIGNLGTLIMLETRLSAREQQVDVRRDMRYLQIKFDVAAATGPVQVGDSETAANVETYNLPFASGTGAPITDYRRVRQINELSELPEGIEYQPDMAAFNTQVLDQPHRRLLGAPQRKFIADALHASTRQRKPWQILGNQTLLANIKTPNFAEKLSEQEKGNLPAWFKPALGWTKYAIPFGTDSWNGYGAEREWLLAAAAETNANLIVLTGDTHAAWGIDLVPQRDMGWQGVELGTTSISSPGLPEALGLSASRLGELLLADNQHLRYSETGHRGYLTLHLTPQQAKAEFHRISTVDDKLFKHAGSDGFLVLPRKSQRGIKLKAV